MKTSRIFALPKRAALAVNHALGTPLPNVLALVRRHDQHDRVIEEQLGMVPIPMFAAMMAQAAQEKAHG